MSGIRALIRCDAAAVPPVVASESWDVQKSIRSRGESTSLTLRAQSLAGTVLTRVADRAADLVRIAAYAYAADQELSRGGEADVYRRDWRRRIAMCVPVADPDHWAQEAVRSRLEGTLGFLTDDVWEFHFSHDAPVDRQITLDVRDHALLGEPDTVVLFSGGADSLCATAELAALHRARPILISHRSAPNIDTAQKGLAVALRHRFPDWGFPHLSFWIHRRGDEPADNSQRSRAFLFASLGAAVAAELGIPRVVLGDNGIVSLNLPISAQLAGALASRATHPKFLHLFNEFIARALAGTMRVDNPLQYRTRAEALKLLAAAGNAALLQETNSCSRGRGRPRVRPHCGYCYQCVDRRFGAIAAGLEEHDLAERYGLDIFTETLPEGEPRTVAESYVRLARALRQTAEDSLFDAYPHLVECILPGDPEPDETARQLIELLKRHAVGVLDVVSRLVTRHSADLAAGTIPEDSLIRLVMGGASRERTDTRAAPNTFRQEGQDWAIIFHGEATRIRAATGVRYIAHLLAHPGEDFHAAELVAGRRLSPEEMAAAWLRGANTGDTDPLLDVPARRAFRHRMEELRADLRQAKSLGNGGRATRIEKELTAIGSALRNATALGGGARTFRGPDDQARESVSKAVNRALRTIETFHPKLRRHLRGSLHIGIRCSYAPDPPTTWLT